MDQQQHQQHQQQQQHARSVSPELSPNSPSSVPVVRANFRSQRITSPPVAAAGPLSFGAAAPPLLQPASAEQHQHFGSSRHQYNYPHHQQHQGFQMMMMNQKLPPRSAIGSISSTSGDEYMSDNSRQQQQTSALPPHVLAEKKEAIGTIPSLPSYHILERTALKIPESSTSNTTTTTTINVVLDRILEHLRFESIRYECEANSGCLECTATVDGDIVGFGIQLWSAQENGNKIVWLEATRREGCSIAMNTIRRNLMRCVMHGTKNNPTAAAAPSAMLGQRRPHQELNSNRPAYLQQQPLKRQRSSCIAPHRARLNCQSALSIALRLLGSERRDQHRLGLESLTVITNPRLVDPTDATTASRAIVLGDGPHGMPLQFVLAKLLNQVHPKRAAQQQGNHYHPDRSLQALLYHQALRVLSNALELMEELSKVEQQQPINLGSPLWQVVMECLLFSLEDANQNPQQAALSAKCIRHLLPATKRAVAAAQQQQQEQMNVTVEALRNNAKRAHQFGSTHHQCLEQESQRLLGSFTNATAA